MSEWIEELPKLPPRPDHGHKGTFGTVVVVGGSPLMIGAPALTATAALRSGAGLVKIASSAEVCRGVIGIQPSVTGMEVDQLAAVRGQKQTVLAVGPGWGGADATTQRVEEMLGWQNTLVVDADGLNALARLGRADRPEIPRDGASWVLTPHPGEYRRLAAAFEIDADPINPQKRPAAADALAHATGAVVVLKGNQTIVSDGKQRYRNLTGNPALATAGTGDVLTGLIAGLIAQGASPSDAAVLGAYLHGTAADLWAQQHGRRGMLAMELADGLTDAIHAFEK